MRTETIIGKVLLNKLDPGIADKLITAQLLAQQYIQCRYCGTILDQSKLGWFEMESGILPQSVGCIDCFNAALPMLKGIVKVTKLKGTFTDSTKLPWSGV
jgi:hypothetical protein